MGGTILLLFGWCYLSPSDEERADKVRRQQAAQEAATDSMAAKAFYHDVRGASPAMLAGLTAESCATLLPRIVAAPASKTKQVWNDGCKRAFSTMPPSITRAQVIAARAKYSVTVLDFDAKNPYGTSHPDADRVRARITNASDVRLPVLTVRTNRWTVTGKLAGWLRTPLLVGHILPGRSEILEFFPARHLPQITRLSVEVEQDLRPSDERFIAELEQLKPPAPPPEVMRKRVPLGTSSDDLLGLLGHAQGTQQVGTDEEGLLVEWRYPEVTYLLGRRELNGVTAYRVVKIIPR